MSLNFEKHAQKGNKFLNELAENLGNKTDTAKAERILRALFQALRNHLTIEEIFQLLSQLPIALKGVYIHGWMPTKEKEVSRKKIDFIEEVLKYADGTSIHGISDIEKGTKEVHVVFKTLKQYISKGEFKDIEAVLPRQLKKLLRESLYTKTLTLNLIPEK
ncbi:MAG: DUF2267 domain-containing protein [Bacteroidetes bacterium]|nr:DUF2267 domain-containing protein [Bacteroidota bacterium]